MTSRRNDSRPRSAARCTGVILGIHAAGLTLALTFGIGCLRRVDILTAAIRSVASALAALIVVSTMATAAASALGPGRRGGASS